MHKILLDDFQQKPWPDLLVCVSAGKLNHFGDEPLLLVLLDNDVVGPCHPLSDLEFFI